jgi:ATP-dependent helicase/nuclease subunit A
VSSGDRDAAARAADAAARIAAQTVFDRAVVREAGAGTGKTSTLVARVVCWCLGPGWERAAGGEARPHAWKSGPLPPERIAAAALEGVVAITFTEAAAAEMAARVARALAAVGRGEAAEAIAAEALPADAETRRERARALLLAVDRLRVSTIHAFCSRLLAANPAEAGVHPAFAVDADETRVEEIVGAAVGARYRREAHGAEADDLVTLAAAGIGPDRMAAALRRLVAEGVPEAALAGDPFASERLAALATALAERVAALAAVIGDRLAAAKAKVPVMVDAATRALRARLGAVSAVTLVDLKALLAEHLPPNLAGRLGEWRRGKLGVEERELLGDVAEGLAAAAGELAEVCRHIERAEEELLRAACRVVAPLLAEVRRTMADGGVVAYADLLSRCRDVLVGQPEVAARERRAIAQLVVDEFQDTDALQCEIVAALALDGPADERPGLFLVGDPKQSIYGWRNADLAAYEAFVERVLTAGGERHALAVNFRSVPAVLDEVERCLGEVMVRDPGVQPAFEPLLVCEARRGDTGFAGGARAPVEHWIVDPAAAAADADGDEGIPGIAEAEAGAVAADVADLHEREGVAWSEVAILMRATTALPVFLQALRDAGVPYVVERDKGYYRRREILDASALVRAVLDPADHVALVAWLRSAAVGVPDAALLPLWARGFPGMMTELAGPDPAALGRLREVIAAAAAATPAVPGIERIAGWEVSLAAAVETLARCRRTFAERPAAELVEELRTATLIEATEAARVLGVYRVANLDRFFRALLAAMEESGSHPQEVLRAMRRALRERRDAEEARLRDAAVEAVRVMTIHKAKGLDFGHVYLVQTGRTARADGVPDAAAARVAGGWEVALFGRPSAGWWQAAARARRVAEAEEVRTLYVAATRARVRLVTAGPWGSLAGGAPRTGQSHLRLLARRRGGVPDAEAMVAAAAHGSRGPLELGGALWRVPAAGAAAGRRDVAAGGGAALASPAEVEAHAAALARLAGAARAHMARPWSGPASAEAHRLFAEAEANAEAGRSPGPRRRDGGNEVATAAGTLVHRFLESLDLDADVAAQLADAPAALARLIAAVDTGSADPAAVARRAEAVLARLAGSPLAARLAAIAPHVVARELPVLLPPFACPPDRSGGSRGAESGADVGNHCHPERSEGSRGAGSAPDVGNYCHPERSEGSRGAGSAPDDAPGASAVPAGPRPHRPDRSDVSPVAFVAGAIDLVYRDTSSGELVIADYKTDEVASDADLAEKAATYRSQGDVYTRALQGALGLPAPPRFELWFLAAGRIVAVES